MAETLRYHMKREGLSATELARRLAETPERVKSRRRLVMRLRSGQTQSIQEDTAAKLEKALGTRGVFTQFVYKPELHGTPAALAELRASLDELRKRLDRLEDAG